MPKQSSKRSSKVRRAQDLFLISYCSYFLPRDSLPPVFETFLCSSRWPPPPPVNFLRRVPGKNPSKSNVFFRSHVARALRPLPWVRPCACIHLGMCFDVTDLNTATAMLLEIRDVAFQRVYRKVWQCMSRSMIGVQTQRCAMSTSIMQRKITIRQARRKSCR